MCTCRTVWLQAVVWPIVLLAVLAKRLLPWIHMPLPGHKTPDANLPFICCCMSEIIFKDHCHQQWIRSLHFRRSLCFQIGSYATPHIWTWHLGWAKESSKEFCTHRTPKWMIIWSRPFKQTTNLQGLKDWSRTGSQTHFFHIITTLTNKCANCKQRPVLMCLLFSAPI